MTSYRVPALAAVAFAVACGAATSADVAAKAGKQELTVTKLSEIIGNSQAPLEKDVARTIAELWINYQLAGTAGAKADSMKDNKLVDDAMWSNLETVRVKKLYETVSKSFDTTTSTAKNEATYASGEFLLAAHHILVSVPQNASPEQKAAAKKKAEGIRAQATVANFAKLAEKSDEPGAKNNGGDLGLFQHSAMVPEFEKAVAALKPGEISQVVETQFGYHVILRTPYAEVKDKFALAMKGKTVAVAESTYLAKLEQANDVKLASNSAVTTKAVSRNPMGYAKDQTAIATYKGGKLTVARMADWIAAYPPNAQIRQQLLQAPDTLVDKFVHQLARNELLLKQADSAKVTIDTAELANFRMQFRSNLTSAWTQLGVDPAKLTDSAKADADRETLAGKRIDTYFDKLVKNEVPFVDIAYPVGRALQTKYAYVVNDAALDKAVERAKTVRATADSLRAKTAKPGMPGGAGPGGQSPQPNPAPPGPPPTKEELKGKKKP